MHRIGRNEMNLKFLFNLKIIVTLNRNSVTTEKRK